MSEKLAGLKNQNNENSSVTLTDTFAFTDITGQGSYQADSYVSFNLHDCKTAIVTILGGQNGICYISGIKNNVSTDLLTLTNISSPQTCNVDCSLYDEVRIQIRSRSTNNVAYSGSIERTF